MAQLVTLPSWTVLPMPEGLSFHEAALLDPSDSCGKPNEACFSFGYGVARSPSWSTSMAARPGS